MHAPTSNDGPHEGRGLCASAEWAFVNVRGEVHAYLVPEDYRRLRLEALARGVSLSRCAADCLGEYFALRREMATAIETETPDQAGTLTPSRVIHVLLAQTEQRLVATLDRHVDELAAVRDEIAAVLTMLDRAHFVYLCHTPEMPPEARDHAYARGQKRRLCTLSLRAGGTPPKSSEPKKSAGEGL
jgi:hypothetical protein